MEPTPRSRRTAPTRNRPRHATTAKHVHMVRSQMQSTIQHTTVDAHDTRQPRVRCRHVTTRATYGQDVTASTQTPHAALRDTVRTVSSPTLRRHRTHDTPCASAAPGAAAGALAAAGPSPCACCDARMAASPVFKASRPDSTPRMSWKSRVISDAVSGWKPGTKRPHSVQYVTLQSQHARVLHGVPHQQVATLVVGVSYSKTAPRCDVAPSRRAAAAACAPHCHLLHRRQKR